MANSMQKFPIIMSLLILFVVFIPSVFILMYDIRAHASLMNGSTKALRSTAQIDADISMDGTLNRIFWFVQISDTHISKFHEPERVKDLKLLCSRNLDIIKPEVVLLTGDITDAKHKLPDWNSDQFIEEWRSYREIFEETNIDKRTVWLDMRGNHDVFNVLSAEAPNNYFRDFSVQGKTYPYSYMYTHRKPYGQYSFVAMDSTPVPGLKRPHNFFGVIVSKVVNALMGFEETLKDSNHTFWMSHYPTSTIVSYDFDLHKFIGKYAIMLFCGHLHSLGGLCDEMYTLQPKGFLELELADWKENRAMRLVAVDHDLVSFTDVRLGTGGGLKDSWPLVLITNPKQSDFLLPSKEPVHRIGSSSHIRVLAFSDAEIVSVQISINGKFYGDAQSAGNGLFVLPWRALDYQSQTENEIFVEVRDSSERVKLVKQTFTVDGKPTWKFSLFASIILGNNVFTVTRVWLLITWLIESMVLFGSVFAVRCHKKASSRMATSEFWLLRGLWRLCSLNIVLWLKIFELGYEFCGPIFIGYLVGDNLTILLPFGVVVNHTFHLEGVTIVEQLFYGMLFKWPVDLVLIWFLSCTVLQDETESGTEMTSLIAGGSFDKANDESEQSVKVISSAWKGKARQIFACLILIVSVSGLVYRVLKFFQGPGGPTAWLTTPGRIAPCIFNLILIIFVRTRLKPIHFSRKKIRSM